ncbi:MAG: isoleucine--tRNA ligase [Ignavibacteriae bacterium]|nr:isoleucine--tRNA ligase [Ignavibacteriota bacterium]
MFKPLPEKLSYPELEHDILKFWENNKIFEKSLKIREGKKSFSFYEGPPTVNGKPGLHHLMARTIKDTICRYKTMTGHYVRRQAGWDTHGLPVEIAVEKELGFNTKQEIVKYGIEKFNKKCKEFVYNNIEMDQGWRYLTSRMGYWLDLDSAYITCTNEYTESVWWALKQFFDKGLIYKGFKVVPQSPTIETPLSSHELSLGYKDVRDPNVYLKLKIKSSKVEGIVGADLMVWTTTPWTLFANVALAVGNDIDYVLIKNKRKIKDEELTDSLVLAKSRLNVIDGEYEILSEFKGKDLIGTEFVQIFDFIKIDKNKYPNALTVLPGDFVSTEDGSGIVHLAPAFGEDDYQMSKKFNLPFLQPVTPNGHFTKELGEFAGRAIKHFTYADHEEEGSDKDIIIALKYAGKIYKATNDYLHSYPHCWRTGNPVMYYARESWFIKSPEYKDAMIEINKKINWQPPEIGTGRFGHWLEDAKEWNLSRDRFWGTPLPVWVSEDGTEMFAIGSISELKEGLYEYPDKKRIPLKETDFEVDLHRPFVDNIVFENNGKLFRRIPEVVDVWFDSGSMPFAQMHYPFENQELFEKEFPGDFIAEGIDQTRGWFYTLHNIATGIFNKPAYKNIIVNELILDKDGIKMSKSKGNVVDPFEVMEEYGADAIRWYLMVNNPPWKATLFNKEDIAKTVISDFFRSLTNTYAFFALYANIYNFTGNEEAVDFEELPEIDRWLYSRVNSLIVDYKKYFDEYDITKALRAVQNFVRNELSNWYIRRNRRRFWKGENDKDKRAAYQTLRHIIINVIKLISPTSPFLAEIIYQNLKLEGDAESIHLLNIPEPDLKVINKELEQRMEIAQTIVFLVRSLRETSKLKVRQPLRRILVPVLSPKFRRDIQHFEEVIKEEINVKEIEFVSGETEIVKKSAKPNFKTIGKKFGKITQQVANAIKELKEKDIKFLEINNSLKLKIAETEIELSGEDVEIISEDIEGWLVASQDNITVALDTQIDDELIKEGIAREFINRIQNLRKNSGYDVTDRINISYNAQENISVAIEEKKHHIMNETLAETLNQSKFDGGAEIDIDDIKIKVIINRF